MPSLRRTTLCLALLALLLVPAAASAAPRRPHVYSDPRDAIGKLDIQRAVLTQHGPQLRLDVTTWRPWSASTLKRDRGRSLCFEFTEKRTRRICVVPGAHGHLSLGLPDSQVTTRGPRGISVTLTAASAGLTAGPFSWRVQSTWVDSHRCQTAGAPGCTDVVPDAGGARTRLAPITPVGCRPRAPWELRSVPAHRREIALTFDDGPAADTPRFVDVLEREHAVATFFMVGRFVPGHGALIQRMLRDGDMVGNHSLTHANLAGGGPRAAFELDRTQDNIRAASGFTPCLFRPPYGASSGALVGEARARGLDTIIWNDDPRDWSLPGAATIHSTVLREATPGGIVIMHDGGGPRGQTLEALPGIIHDLRARGYTFVTVTDLLGLRIKYRQ